MKTSALSIKELAVFIGVSTDTIRRAVRQGEIPSTRVRTALRFDRQEVLTCMQRNAEAKFGTRSSSAPGGTAGRAQDETPPSGNTEHGGVNYTIVYRHSTNSMRSMFPLTMSERVSTSHSAQETVPMLDFVLVEAAKREVYTPGHGETITPSPTGKE